MTNPNVVPSGWFPDPWTPGSERWWNGTEWTSATHRTPSPSWDWMPAYTRAMWPGLNSLARAARVVGIIAILLAFPAVLLALVLPVVGVLLCLVMLALGLATIGLGAAALTRSAREGGKGLAIWAIAVPVVFVLPVAVVIALLALILPSAS